MNCSRCWREAPALYPGNVCVRYFDFVAYAAQPLPAVRNADVDRAGILRAKRECYHRRQKKKRAVAR